MGAQLLIVVALVLGSSQGGPSPKPKNPGLATVLAKMVKVDQDLRMKMIDMMKGDKPFDPQLMRSISAIDAENTGRLRTIVKTYGWPTIELVGQKGSGDAWLLVQHADQNPKFQRECLELMRPLVPIGQIDKRNFAYLTDRVLVAEGKKQLYGSQFQQEKDGRWKPKPIEDPDNVDKRRAEMGLEPLAEYAKVLESMYGTKPPPTH